MKKTLFAFAGCVLLGFGCTKTNLNDEGITSADPTNNLNNGKRICYSQEHLQEQLAADPSLAARMQSIEEFTARFAGSAEQARLLAGGIIEIPVWVNVLYATSAQNISDARIASQIKVLNDDFQALNADYNSTPSVFQSVRSGDIGVRFVLAGVTRKSTTKSSWRTDDAMKKSTKGGINPTSPTTTLNLWSCNMSGGILGYAQFPGGAAATDGVVIDDGAFGINASNAPYGLGRTATHEVGHWMNLRHIWGDATCGNDFVTDTPTAHTANYNCPGTIASCETGKNEMTMNYMDYTNDACMYMFTLGQKARMQTIFASGGPRNTFAQP